MAAATSKGEHWAGSPADFPLRGTVFEAKAAGIDAKVAHTGPPAKAASRKEVSKDIRAPAEARAEIPATA